MAKINAKEICYATLLMIGTPLNEVEQRIQEIVSEGSSVTTDMLVYDRALNYLNGYISAEVRDPVLARVALGNLAMMRSEATGDGKYLMHVLSTARDTLKAYCKSTLGELTKFTSEFEKVAQIGPVVSTAISNTNKLYDSCVSFFLNQSSFKGTDKEKVDAGFTLFVNESLKSVYSSIDAIHDIIASYRNTVGCASESVTAARRRVIEKLSTYGIEYVDICRIASSIADRASSDSRASCDGDTWLICDKVLDSVDITRYILDWNIPYFPKTESSIEAKVSFITKYLIKDPDTTDFEKVAKGYALSASADVVAKYACDAWKIALAVMNGE